MRIAIYIRRTWNFVTHLFILKHVRGLLFFVVIRRQDHVRKRSNRLYPFLRFEIEIKQRIETYEGHSVIFIPSLLKQQLQH